MSQNQIESVEGTEGAAAEVSQQVPKKEAPHLNILELSKKTTIRKADIEFRDGMFFNLSFLPRPKFQALAKQATRMVISQITRTREPEVDNDKYIKLLVSECVHGWSGVTPRKIASLIAIDLTNLTESEKDALIPYSQPQMELLMREAYEVDRFVQDMVQDLRNFEPHAEHETKNSESSQSGS